MPVGRYCVENPRGALRAVLETSAPVCVAEAPAMTHVVAAHDTAAGFGTGANDGIATKEVLPAAVAASWPGEVTERLVTTQQT
jgi:hypothetical protein